MYLRQLNRPSANFTMVPNRLCGMGLSLDAIGLMVWISVWDAQDLSVRQIEQGTGIGRDKRKRIMAELRKKQLLHLVRDQMPDGRWISVYIFDWDAVCDGNIKRKRHKIEDFQVLEEPATEKPSSVEKPVQPEVVPATENPSSGRKTRRYIATENPSVPKEEGGAAPLPQQRAAAAPPANKDESLERALRLERANEILRQAGYGQVAEGSEKAEMYRQTQKS